MKEANNVATFRIQSRNVWSLEAIAVNASKCQIVKLAGATVLASDDVICLGRRWVKCRW